MNSSKARCLSLDYSLCPKNLFRLRIGRRDFNLIVRPATARRSTALFSILFLILSSLSVFSPKLSAHSTEYLQSTDPFCHSALLNSTIDLRDILYPVPDITCPTIRNVNVVCDSLDADGHEIYTISFGIADGTIDSMGISSPDGFFSPSTFYNVTNSTTITTTFSSTSGNRWIKLVYKSTVTDSCICCIMIQLPLCSHSTGKMKVALQDLECAGFDKNGDSVYNFVLGIDNYTGDQKSLSVSSSQATVNYFGPSIIPFNSTTTVSGQITAIGISSLGLDVHLLPDTVDTGSDSVLSLSLPSGCDAGYASAIEAPEQTEELLPANQPEQDSSNAIPVCRQSYVQNNWYQGAGRNTNEIGGATCLLAGEKNSVWYIFTTQSAGTFGFTLNQGNNDYDFALYDITGTTCAALPNLIPVRCNYSARTGVNNPNTGLQCDTIFGGNLSYSAGQPPMMPGINVTANRTYVLLISNWSVPSNGYTLTFCGTASIINNTPPSISAVSSLTCAGNTILVTLNKPVLCSTISRNGTGWSITGPTAITVSGADGVNCTANGYTSQVLLHLKFSASSNCGNYTLSATNTNTITDLCGNHLTSGSHAFSTAAAVASFTLQKTTYCAGDDIVMDGSASLNADRFMVGILEIDKNGAWHSEDQFWTINQAPGSSIDLTQLLQSHNKQFNCGSHYRIKLAVQNCCTNWSEHVVFIQIKCPVIDPGPNQSICRSSLHSVTLGTAAVSGQTYLWEPGGQTTAQIIVLPSQTTTYTLTVTGNGCTQTAQVTVFVIENPTVSIVQSGPDVCTQIQTLTAVTSGGGGGTVTWSPGGSHAQSIRAVQIDSLGQSTTYTVTYSTPCGNAVASITPPCRAHYIPHGLYSWNASDFLVPNAFTPNGDGLNDYFDITDQTAANHCQRLPYDAVRYEFKVWNRWGEVVTDKNVTSSTGFANQTVPHWDGTATDHYHYKCHWYDDLFGPSCKGQPGWKLPSDLYRWTLDFYSCTGSWLGELGGYLFDLY